MNIKEMMITADLATDLLEKNINNRPLNMRRVNVLCDAMRRGEWMQNGDTIRVSKTGRLLDGQHRLSAIEKTGIPQKCILVFDLEDESFTTIDTGQARTAGQMAQMAGFKNANILAAAARMHLMFELYGQPFHGTATKTVTHAQVIDFCENEPGIHKSVFATASKWSRKYVTPSIAAFCHYEFGISDAEVRDAFFEELESGEFSYQRSPIKVLREFMLSEYGQPKKTDKGRKIAMMFKAFRLFRDGSECKLIRPSKDTSEWFKL